MGFGKAFILGLVIYIALNFVFQLIGALLLGTLATYFGFLTTDPLYFIYGLFAPIVVVPGVSFIYYLALVMEGGALMLAYLVAMLGLILPALLAAIIAGRLGGGKGASFGAWFLIAIICTVVTLVFVIIGSAGIDASILAFATRWQTPSGPLAGITLWLGIVMAGIVSAFFYGAFALLTSSEGF
jgi:hypothetical protein